MAGLAPSLGGGASAAAPLGAALLPSLSPMPKATLFRPGAAMPPPPPPPPAFRA
eukprot:CAMPEP_0185456420 /NCGR_PEP_ID=MMETSP1365-20130426/77451_1 /TAXON_ID=38817 /ORGANISM="Gephyrocapsa oceanica, Strain RCC1303" /LENGTH=53 /DNA_ID=CAMNT_0028062841 /DNA_START=60 /DNA_END=217 /DNA_ORIENTATION=+